MSHTLYYIYDPLCGWCYGASELANAASGIDNIALTLRAGGLWPEPTKLPNEMRRYIQQADARNARLNGVAFGDAYLTGLLFDPGLVLESRPVVAAILAVRSLDPAKELEMLNAIQRAHYIDGRHVVRSDVLADLAAGLGFDTADFGQAIAAAPVDAHIAETRELMARVGATGFPTFVLEIGGRMLGVPHHEFAGNPPGFIDWLERTTNASPARAGAGSGPAAAAD